MPSLSFEDSFVPPAHHPLRKKVQTSLRRLGVAGLLASSAFRLDAAAAPYWEASLGQNTHQIEQIVAETIPSDDFVVIATIPGFNANYDDMAQVKKGLAEEFNTRLQFVRNGNAGVDATAIATSLSAQFLPDSSVARRVPSTLRQHLILDGHSMGGLVSLEVAAWFTRNLPDVQVAIVLDSSPHDVEDVQGFFGQVAVRGLSVSAKNADTANGSLPTIGPGARLLTETLSRVAENPLQILSNKQYVPTALAGAFRNLQPGAKPLSSTSLADEAYTITNALSETNTIETLRKAGVTIIRLSPTRDTTVYNDSSVAKFANDFGQHFCNLPVAGALHGAPNERVGHNAYMDRLRQILWRILGLPPRRTLPASDPPTIARLTITPQPPAARLPLAKTC